ncbi:amidohydrolase family protein [Streptacidiphilus monticola]|uniref:Amidohydrolase family protein n=1 Tax=Streptacidiphilus monticola TaxID=2161674 RepID=A0ABW1G988_9ACTN
MSTDAGPAVLDCHVHLWDPRRLSYPWLAELPALQHPFTAEEFAKVRPAAVEVIFMEAGREDRHAEDELAWVRAQAEHHPWIRGAVAHVPLERPAEALDAIRRYAADPFVVGVRRNLQDEAPGFTEGVGFRSGLQLLGEAGLPFDACVRRHQLPELARLAAACPDTVIVLDHLGKPQPEATDQWSKDLRQVAQQPNVICKLSGLATELGPHAPAGFGLGLLREALEVFGPDRCLFGSDWPLLQLATDYRSWLDLVREALAEHPPAATDAVLRGTAERVYRPAPSPKEAP